MVKISILKSVVFAFSVFGRGQAIRELEECFNLSLIEIEKAFKKVFNEEIKPIAVSEEEWEPIKVKFNKHMKSKTNAYEYKEEVMSLKDIYDIKDKENISNTNEIEEIFEDMIVYN